MPTELSFDAIYGLFMPQRLHMRLEGSVAEYAGADATLRAQATTVHEHLHFFQTILTGYGHIAWDSHRQATSYLVHEWKKIATAPDGKRRLPLAHVARLGPHQLLAAFVGHRTTLDMIRLGMARFLLPDPNVTLAQLGIRLVPQPWATNPTISIGGRPHTLQGKEVVEGHAQFVEATFLELWHQLSREQAWDRSGVPDKYFVALDWFVQQCGEERRAEFPFVCDLALQTSWDPVLPSTEEEWRAYNPAWRFVRLTELLRNMPKTMLGPPKAWPSTYAPFAEELLSAAGFRQLSEVFSERLAAFQRKPQLLNLEKLMQSGMEFRQRMPWCGGNPVADKGLWDLMTRTFRAPIVEIGGSLTGPGLGDAKANAEVVMELQFQAFAAQIFGDFSRAALNESTIECAFSKFDIPQGCEFQRTDFCKGRYRPADGPPHPIVQAEDGSLGGCSFEMLLMTAGLRSVDLDVDHTAKMPTDEELAEMERQAAGRIASSSKDKGHSGT